MKWNNNFPISWPYLAKGWCCSFHKKPWDDKQEDWQFQLHNTALWETLRTRKHNFSIWFTLGISLICFLWNTDFALQIETPSQNAVLNLPYAQHQSLLIFFPPLFLFFPHFSFFPHFLMIPPRYFTFSRDLLAKTLSSRRKIKGHTSQRNLHA